MKTNHIWQGNKAKHTNLLFRIVLNKFKKDLYDLVYPISPKKVLDIGCGEGFITNFLARNFTKTKFEAIDLEKSYITYAKDNNLKENIDFKVGDLFKLEYPKSKFDLVISLEVLEHLNNPGQAVENMLKLSKKYAIFSVPNEPFFSLANICRLKYLKSFGNTPGHIQRWSPNQFKKVLANYGKIIKLKKSTFWTFVLIEKLEYT